MADISRELIENRICHIHSDLISVVKQLKLLQDFVKNKFGQEFNEFVEEAAATRGESRLIETFPNYRNHDIQTNCSPSIRPTRPRTRRHVEQTSGVDTTIEGDRIEVNEGPQMDIGFEFKEEVLEAETPDFESTHSTSEYRVLDFGQSSQDSLSDSIYVNDGNAVGEEDVDSNMIEEDVEPFKLLHESQEINTAKPVVALSSNQNISGLGPSAVQSPQRLTRGVRQTDHLQKRPGQTSVSGDTKRYYHRRLPTNTPCPICHKILKYGHMISRHIERMHPDIKRLPCSQCDSTFHLRHQLDKHLKKHEKFAGRPLLSCHVCHKKFLEKIPLDIHLKDVHDIVKWSFDQTKTD